MSRRGRLTLGIDRDAQFRHQVAAESPASQVRRLDWMRQIHIWGEKGPMDDGDTRLESLIDRLDRGDAAATRELIGLASERLSRLTASLMTKFPELRQRHEPNSVVNTVYEKLHRAIAESRPPTPRDLFGLSAHVIRLTLLDVLRKDRRHDEVEGARLVGDGSSAGVGAPEPGTESSDPQRLAYFTEVHEAVGQLPPDQREAFGLCHYQGLTQAEAAHVMGIHERTVSRLCIAARATLAAKFAGLDELL
jgi:RNA polymerase sigma-70 factor (ECF subfamily)